MSTLAEARDRALLYLRLLPLDPVAGVALVLEALKAAEGEEDPLEAVMDRLLGGAPPFVVPPAVPPLRRGPVVPEELETSPLRAFVAGRRRRLRQIVGGDRS